MARYSNALTSVFEAYGEDAKSALEAYGNVDNEGWSCYVDAAAEKQYLADYRNWSRQLVGSVARERLERRSGQARLFELDETATQLDLRRRLRLDGEEFDLAALADTSTIRKVADRDESGARTTLVRSRVLRKLADHMDAESERLGRPVTAGEVLGWAA